uniref:Uncharacterized protein n=1 Tax=Trichobilharzia regenti TaxID=157069 RepID=A0AA85ISC7_TRIRE|nr:unnamed protein product [Trichobilharzia regenti]
MLSYTWIIVTIVFILLILIYQAIKHFGSVDKCAGLGQDVETLLQQIDHTCEKGKKIDELNQWITALTAIAHKKR